MKTCGECGEEKHESNFHFRNKKKGTRKSWCKECNKKYDAKLYKNRSPEWRQEKREKGRKIAERNRRFIWEYLSNHPCVCGETHPILLEFDHNKDEKKREPISNMVSSGCSIEVIKKEIEKCVVRCVKCHRLKTAKEEGWYKEFNWE